ncbi:MAG: tRNA guanosine(34) transglycosylase Tgt [Patescibacteria group bacterium]|jgi:queuine tRNA-ribosyltransferase
MNNFFKVSHRSSKSKARLGEIHSDHGVVKTPAFLAAATKGTIKTLTPQQVKEIGIQGSCVNTYHLVTHPGADIIEKAGGIQKYSNLDIFTMSDSGGFQVFSLARTEKARSHKFLSLLEPLRSREVQSRKNLGISPSQNETRKADVRGEEEPFLVKISEDGVKFRSTFDGTLIEFTPEKSMEFQRKIGADINMAFDECTYYPATHEYAEKAMSRTHEWLKRCIKYKVSSQNFLSPVGTLPAGSGESQVAKNSGHSPLPSNQVTHNQFLYGIIQGGIFEDLRKKSAEFVVSQGTPGIAIGGVSVGETKAEMRDQVRWVSNYLPKDRPVHLLGVGQIDDIIELVKYGIDTFDCVEPTRLARMGTIYQGGPLHPESEKNLRPSLSQQIDINKSIYKNNFEKVDVDCECYVCKNFTKSYLHHLFKQREILGYTLATFHNLWVMEKLFEGIRERINRDLI